MSGIASMFAERSLERSTDHLVTGLVMEPEMPPADAAPFARGCRATRITVCGSDRSRSARRSGADQLVKLLNIPGS